MGVWVGGSVVVGGATTSTSFLDHFSRISQLLPTPHAPWAVFYLVPGLSGLSPNLVTT